MRGHDFAAAVPPGVEAQEAERRRQHEAMLAEEAKRKLCEARAALDGAAMAHVRLGRALLAAPDGPPLGMAVAPFAVAAFLAETRGTLDAFAVELRALWPSLAAARGMTMDELTEAFALIAYAIKPAMVWP